MANIDIDIERCTQCAACIDICSGDVLVMGQESPEIAYPERCTSCGHCSAICPVDAISSNQTNSRAPFTVEEIPSTLSPEQALFYLKRSTREFTEEKLEEDTIKTLIRAAEKAPSSHNFRQREYVVVTDRAEIRRLEEVVTTVYRSLLRILKPAVIKLIGLFSKPMARGLAEFAPDFKNLVKKTDEGKSHIFRGAPCVIFLAAPKNYDQSRDDCVAAQHYMMLYAQTLGIGSCIIGYAQYAHKKLERYLKIPKGKKIYAVAIFGYPRHRYGKTVRFREPTVTWK